MKLTDRNLLRARLPPAGDAPPAIVIVMPRAIHIGDLALRYLRDYSPVLAIANGLADWEVEAMQARHGSRVVALSQVYEHSEIINTLIALMPAPFWLVDHDCYVLDPSVLRAGGAGSPGSPGSKDLDGGAGQTFFSTTNAANGLVVPETFLVRLNPRVIRRLRRTYGVSAKKYWWTTLPARARERLEAMGISEERRPEKGKHYFDTLRVIALLAQADGCAFDICRDYTAVCRRHADVVHIGATSWPTWPPPDRYAAIGAFFWQRCLAACPVPRARAEYPTDWPDLPDSETIRQQLLDTGLLLPGDAPVLLDFLDSLIQGPGQHSSLFQRPMLDHGMVDLQRR